MFDFGECPRCGSRSLECLKTYAHCANCLYVDDGYEDSESFFFRAVQIEREVFGALENQHENFERTA